ncbi:hypothetical protein SDRG_03592 [Saprolegnia diclina VS20]|uniref:Uncharacterized protein n=1 Tax=Saprolegnia diclina (strain VS20) TaxID=1156394 RepID=T0QZ96_SAPDV|nr:hypothetical protein SDRG_03592 [Saprolegnia diclina VS20]EQC39390.1 hypothetical protein SDRG_03592 [Saprolegnia diclina VS20]|eukprot:XP_008607451.1 hypothetical protein SDRG_03592 [Saprolegnia diclina VS20]
MTNGQRKQQQRGKPPAKTRRGRGPTGKEPFEEAVALLRRSATHSPAPWAMFEIPHPIEPLLHVDTMDEWLGWPLCKPQAHHVMDAYKSSHGVAIVPAAHLTIESDDWREAMDTVVRQHITDAFLSEGAFSLQLSHFVLDFKGSASSLVPATRPARSVGTVCLHLSSMYTGGEVTLTSGGGLTRAWELKRFLTRLQCLVLSPSTTISIDPITYGQRAILVYHLVDESPSTYFDDAVAKLTVASRVRHPVFSVGGIRLASPNPTLARDKLAPVDLDFARALLASNAYDVVIAEHKENFDLFGVGGTGYSPELLRVQALRELPDVIADNLTNVSVQAYLFDKKADPRKIGFSGPQYSLVFWPKAARALVAKLSTAVSMLVNAMAATRKPSSDALLGQPSIAALVETLVPRFGKVSEIDEPEFAHSLHTYCDALIALRRLGTASRLLGAVLRVGTAERTFLELSPCIAKLVQGFGWEPLFAPMNALLDRWSKSLRGVGLCHGLVASLAGAAESPLCATIEQPFAVEWIVAMWSRLSTLVDDLVASDKLYDDATLPCIVFQYNLLLHMYLVEPARHLSQRWLYNRLPDGVVTKIGSFLGPVPTLNDLDQNGVFVPVPDMSPGLAAALRLHQTVDTTYLHRVVDDYMAGEFGDYDDDRDFNQELATSLLAVAAAAGRFTDVLNRLIAGWRLALAVPMTAFLGAWPALATADVQRACASALLRIADELRPDDFAPPMFDFHMLLQDPATDNERSPVVSQVVATFAFFATYDRADLVAIQTKWIAAVVRTADAVRTTFCDVIEAVHERLPTEHALVAHLARAYLEATAAADHDATQQLTDYALLHIEVPACCELSIDFAEFLHDPIRDEFRVNDIQACDKIGPIVAGHPLQLRVHERTMTRDDDMLWGDDDEYDDEYDDDQIVVNVVTKVRQPGQVPVDVLRSHLRRRRDYDKTLARSRRVADILQEVTEDILQEVTESDDGE